MMSGQDDGKKERALATEELLLTPSHSPSPFPLRALILGGLLVTVNCYWMMIAEYRWYFVLSLNPLFVTPVVFLVGLTILNLLLRRIIPQWSFSAYELLIIYIMLVLSCTIATHDFLINLFGIVGWPYWFATAHNRWEDIMFPHLPNHLLINDKDALSGFFQGGKALSFAYLRSWIGPLGWWFLFVSVTYLVLFCLTLLCYKPWVEQSRLSFPVVRLPQEVLSSPKSFFVSRLLWLGFFLSSFGDLWNGLSQIYPSIPSFRLRARFHSFPDLPWSYLSGITTSLYPFAIGLSYFVQLDVLLSCWFFYLLARFQPILGWWVGWTNIPGFPFLTEQGIGGWMGYGVLLVYSLFRRHQRAWQDALPTGCSNNLGVGLSLSLGLASLVLFWWKSGGGLLWSAIFVISYFLVSIAITRVRAEAGGQHTVWEPEPMRIVRLVNSQRLGSKTLVVAALSHWFWRLNRSHFMPSLLEAFRLGRFFNGSPSLLTLPSFLSIAIALPTTAAAILHISYREGALTKCIGFPRWCGSEAFHLFLHDALTNGWSFDARRWLAVSAGILSVSLFSALSQRLPWFPFSPLGYCIGISTPGLIWLWFPIMITWAAKGLILRYGGNRLYHQLQPFFFGLILGDYTAGALWSLAGALWRLPNAYQIFH
ncbi:MAG: hypothetical protein NZ959_09430 [Armatimonadetes bacterium]|nr:hypothetical protein [Armatimonadota bacterium]MDW8122192.1 DUF6785 family protein [Armatimonadota bacterium]